MEGEDRAGRAMQVPLKEVVVAHPDESFLKDIAGAIPAPPPLHAAACTAPGRAPRQPPPLSPVHIMFAPSLVPVPNTMKPSGGRRWSGGAGGAGELGVYVREELNVVSLVTCSDLLQYSTMRAAPDFKVPSLF